MVEQTQPQKPTTFFVAVDGSDASDDAFSYCRKDIMKTKRDYPEGQAFLHPELYPCDDLVVGTIANHKKESYLPYNMKADYLQERYEAKVVEIGKHGRFASREFNEEEKKTTKELIWELAEFEKSDIIVVGNHGRKGPRKDETVCGTLVQYLALNNKFPVLIVKDYRPRTVKPDGCLRWGICYDGSAKSKKAFGIVLNTMKQCDKLAVIHVKEDKKG